MSGRDDIEALPHWTWPNGHERPNGHGAQQLDTLNTNGQTNGHTQEPGTPVLHEAKSVPEALFRRRHIQFLVICLSIGTGVFFGTGQHLAKSGPVSLFLSYVFAATVISAVMMTACEMVTFLPIRGAVFMIPYRFLNPQIGVACGYLFAFAFAVNLANYSVAFAEYLQYWGQPNRGVAIGLFLLLPLSANFLNVRKYGEFEFWATLLKITVIIIIIIVGGVFVAGGTGSLLLGLDVNYRPVPCSENAVTLPCVEPPGFIYWKKYPFLSFTWTNSGFGYAAGFIYSLNLAMFSMAATAMVGVLADETERQRESLPIAYRRIFSRLLTLYILVVLILGMTVSPNDPLLSLPSYEGTPRSYPGGFIIMAERAGLFNFAHFINATMILAVFSAGTADVYFASRCIETLAEAGYFPRCFKPVTDPSGDEVQRRNQQFYHISPARMSAVVVSATPAFCALLILRTTPANFFQIVTSLNSTAGMIPWVIICLTYPFFKKDLRDNCMAERLEPASQAAFQPFLAWYGGVMSFILVILGGFQTWKWDSMTDQCAMSSWAVMATFLLIVGGLSLRMGTSPFARYNVPIITKTDGKAPPLEDLEIIRSPWKRRWEAFLDAL